jgi:hypothetical protein
MTRYWQRDDPFSVEAICNREQAEQLARFDHHQVIVMGCRGILLTFHWPPTETASEPLLASVILNPEPTLLASEDQVRSIIRKHPVVPPHIQAVVDQLLFRPAET